MYRIFSIDIKKNLPKLFTKIKIKKDISISISDVSKLNSEIHINDEKK